VDVIVGYVPSGRTFVQYQYRVQAVRPFSVTRELLSTPEGEPGVPVAPNYRVRAGEPSDLSEVLALYNHYVERTASTFEVSPVTSETRREWFREHSTAGRHRLLVASDPERRIVGWATTSPFRPRAAYATTVEASVYVRDGWSGQGIGSALYTRLFESIQEEDIERVVAGITLPNPASVALHRRFGFRHVGTFSRVGRKFGRYWDVAWYERPRTLPPA
jgi:phosphinothricin acetyltransferase